MERNTLCRCGSKKKYKKCCLPSDQKMPDRMKINESSNEIDLPLTSEEIPLETFIQLIECGLVKDEVPFELIAEEYPSLLDKWYPGYPGAPREMTAEDPFCVDGCVEGDFLIVRDIPGLDKLPLPAQVNEEFGAGKCKAWLKKDGDSWMATLQRA